MAENDVSNYILRFYILGGTLIYANVENFGRDSRGGIPFGLLKFTEPIFTCVYMCAHHGPLAGENITITKAHNV